MVLTNRLVAFCREGQRDGIWAYDVAQNERVLVIPAVLALLGDNPMQSELSCHVGLAGKFFCRCCWVKGRDAEDEAANKTMDDTSASAENATRTSTSTMAGSTNPSESDHAATSSNTSSASLAQSGSTPTPNTTSAKKKGRAQETKQQLVERATRFLGVSFPRLYDMAATDPDSIFSSISLWFGEIAQSL